MRSRTAKALIEEEEVEEIIPRTALVQLARQLQPITKDYADTANTMAAMLFARGCDSAEVAKMLGIDVHQADLIEANPRVQDAIEVIRKAIIDNPMLILDTMVPKAFKSLDRALDCGDSRVEIAAANSLLDRKYGKAIQRQMSVESHNYNFTITHETQDGKQYIQQDLAPKLPDPNIIEGESRCLD